MNEYLRWLEQLPMNRRRSRRSWVGVYQVEDGYVQTFEAWQQRAIERDAQRGVIARWLRWLQ